MQTHLLPERARSETEMPEGQTGGSIKEKKASRVGSPTIQFANTQLLPNA